MTKDEAHLIVYAAKKKYLDFTKSREYNSTDAKALEKEISKAKKAWMKLVAAELKAEALTRKVG